MENHNEKLKSLINGYREKLEEMGFSAKKADLDKSNCPARMDINHCIWMLYEMEKIINEEKYEKAYRWIGFIQGCLWCCGVFTIAEMQKHNAEFVMEEAA